MKIHGLVPYFYHDISGSNLYIPMIGLIWYLYFLEQYCIRELLAQQQELREGRELPPSSGWWQFPACPPIRSCGWAKISHKWPTYKFPIWKFTDHKWKQLILVVNFLFGLRVNEIPNKTFTLESHRPFICSAEEYNMFGDQDLSGRCLVIN